MSEARSISAAEFAALDLSDAVVVDLREEDQIIAQGAIPGAVKASLAHLGTDLGQVPQGFPTYVICATGNLSAQVVEILAERGYEAYDVEGGYAALRSARGEDPESAAQVAEELAREQADVPEIAANEPVYVDARGLKCPGPIVATADALRTLPVGSRVRVQATEYAFASDLRGWCARTGNLLESLETDDGTITAVVRRARTSEQNGSAEEERHAKTFVIFSGDLDKTIAAFIMANGGAAMDRPVTMFFTFWGLNILRKPEKVSVAKTLIERLFGWMMPRGTTKLGLSRMNMGGMGPKMIRWLMREHGISSLEELIADAQAHGVRIVACQMSMDIMGIKKEELIDGIDYVGVGTMLASAEQSDLTFFI